MSKLVAKMTANRRCAVEVLDGVPFPHELVNVLDDVLEGLCGTGAPEGGRIVGYMRNP